MKKILVIRFSSIGDIVLTSPVVRCLKQQLKAEVHFLTKESFKPILEANPFIDHLHLLNADNLSDILKRLKKEKFDYVVDLHNNLRSTRVKWALNKPGKSVNKLNIEKWLLVNFKLNFLPNKHIVDRYFEAVEPLEVKNDHGGLDYFIPEKDEVEMEWLPEPFRKEYHVVNIGGQHFTKRLPNDRIIELCDRINKPIILLGGKEEYKNGEYIAKFFHRWDETREPGLERMNKKALIFNGCGKFNINQSAHLIRHAKVVYTHDTGLMHVAAAFKKRTYSIWGNTVPEFGMYPYLTNFIIWENKPLSCRPCTKIGKNQCPRGHFKCMQDIKFEF